MRAHGELHSTLCTSFAVQLVYGFARQKSLFAAAAGIATAMNTHIVPCCKRRAIMASNIQLFNKIECCNLGDTAFCDTQPEMAPIFCNAAIVAAGSGRYV